MTEKAVEVETIADASGEDPRVELSISYAVDAAKRRVVVASTTPGALPCRAALTSVSAMGGRSISM
jgi:hypothetical protein